MTTATTNMQRDKQSETQELQKTKPISTAERQRTERAYGQPEWGIHNATAKQYSQRATVGPTTK